MIGFKEHKVTLFQLHIFSCIHLTNTQSVFSQHETLALLLLWVTIATACNNHEPKESPKAASRIQEPSPQVKRLYQSVASYPDSIGLRLLLVNALDSAGDYRHALQQMDSLLRKDSLNFGLWFRKATLQEHTKDTSGALQSYHFAARIYPSPDALLAMANLLARTTGCVGGITFDRKEFRKASENFCVSSDTVKSLYKEFNQRSVLFKATGCMHSAAIADREKIVIVAEDIGRHNAVDKVIGHCIIENIGMEDKMMLVSGRLSSEIVSKCARWGIPVLVSRTSPTSYAIETAEKANITLVGFVRGERYNVYTNGQRIIIR